MAGENALAVIDATSMAVTANIPVTGGSLSIAISPDGKTLYVPNYDADTVAVVDTVTKTVTTTITVGAAPDCVAVSPDGQWVYVAAYVGGTVSVIRSYKGCCGAHNRRGSSLADYATTSAASAASTGFSTQRPCSLIRSTNRSTASASGILNFTALLPT